MTDRAPIEIQCARCRRPYTVVALLAPEGVEIPDRHACPYCEYAAGSPLPGVGYCRDHWTEAGELVACRGEICDVCLEERR